MRISRLALLLSALLLVQACFSRQGKTSLEGEVRKFPVTRVPEMLSSPQEQFEYLVMHYWDAFTDTAGRGFRMDSLHIDGVDRDAVEKEVGTYSTLLRQLPIQTARGCLEHLAERLICKETACPSSNAFEQLRPFIDSYVNDPNSPVRYEEAYRGYALAMAECPLLDEVVRGLYARQASLALLNATGTVASDFTFIDLKGRTRSLHSLRSPLTLLVFGNPVCTACKELTEALSIPFTEELIKSGKLLVVDVYIDEDIDTLFSSAKDFPTDWTIGYDPYGILRGDSLYYIRAIPSMYLLGPDKTVILRDTTTEGIIGYLEQTQNQQI